jgi:hypothetical protein
MPTVENHDGPRSSTSLRAERVSGLRMRSSVVEFGAIARSGRMLAG